MESISVHVEAGVNPTESEEKVKRAMENMFGPLETSARPISRWGKVSATRKGAGALVDFRNLLRRERIRAAARTILVRGIDRNTIMFCLNKQVAFAGHVSFCQAESESPLGPITARIECENPRWIIEWLTSENV